MSPQTSRAIGRFEILELYRDDGIKTFDARDTSTGRPVQVHLFVHPSPENSALISELALLPEESRRRILERGEFQGVPYVVTDLLAGQAGFREWLAAQILIPPPYVSVDAQFARLFEDQPSAAGFPEPGSPVQAQPPSASVNSAARAAFSLGLGVLAAVLFLALAMALFALRPW